MQMIGNEAWSRVSKAVRKSEGDRPPVPDVRPGSPGGIVVEVTGPAQLVTTTPSLGTTTSSTTAAPTTTTADPCATSCTWTCAGDSGWQILVACPGGCTCPGPPADTCDGSTVQPDTTISCTSSATTTTPCIGNSTTGTATTTSSALAKYVYPGRFSFRNMDALTNEEWWWPGDNVLIQEVNNRALGLGCRYPGQLIGQYQETVLIGVRNDAANPSAPCAGASDSTTTTCGCLGICHWKLVGDTWELGTDVPDSDVEPNGCDLDLDCDCPKPNFCPPDPGCSNTITFCSHAGDPTIDLIKCPQFTTTTSNTGTGTTVTTTTTTTTTTTPDPGAGHCSFCLWRHVPGIGNVLVSADCSGIGLPSGWTCVPCPSPGAIPECSTASTPCGVLPPPPPPPGCDGYCTWVWPDYPGLWWIATYIGCFSGLPPICYCDSPSVPGSACGQRVSTPCHEPPPPPSTSGTGTGTGTGTGSSSSTTSSSTTTTRGGCLDQCTMRWDSDAMEWFAIRDCGSGCACETPVVDGETSCDIIQVPCKPTTTATTTSTTSTTTTTTACTNSCEWECIQDSLRFGWRLNVACEGPCYCLPPSTSACNEGKIGLIIYTSCFPTTTSSVTTTSTTTTESPCLHTFCVFRCVNIHDDDFSWVNECSNCVCEDGSPDTCSFNPACGPCTSVQEGNICPGICDYCSATTSATSTSIGGEPTGTFTTSHTFPPPPTTSAP